MLVIRVEKSKTMSESELAVPTPVDPTDLTPVDLMQDIPPEAEPMSAEANVASELEPDAPAKDAIYNDPKYLKVLDVLTGMGFIGSKFLGKSGYLVPMDNYRIKIICPSIEQGFKLRITGGSYSSAEVLQLSSEIMKYTEMVDQLNAVLSGATDVSTMDRHVNESQDPANKLIEVGSVDWGKPGTYVCYRNGGRQSKRGFIGFTDTEANADKYRHGDTPTEKFIVTVTNPLTVSGATSYEAWVNACQKLLHDMPELDPTKEKINDLWRNYDSQLAKALTDQGYDSMIYIVPQNSEINVVGTDIDQMPNVNDYTESVPYAINHLK